MIGKLIDELLTIVKILFDHYHIFRILILNCDISSTSRYSVRIIRLALLLNLVVFRVEHEQSSIFQCCKTS